MSRGKSENLLVQVERERAVGRRLAEVLEGKGLTQADLARLLAVSEMTVSGYVHGMVRISAGFAERLARALDISPGWLLFGEQETARLTEGGGLARFEAKLDRLRESVREAASGGRAADHVRQLETMIEEARRAVVEEGGIELPRRQRMQLPVTGRVSANAQANVAWDPIDPPEWVPIPDGAELRRVVGDSMRPIAWDGQAIIVIPKPVRHGDLAAIELSDGRQFFKRFWHYPDRGGIVILTSTNETAPEEPVVTTLKQVKDARRYWSTVADKG